MMAGEVPRSSAPYYRDRYWNELPAVIRHLQRRATGDPNMDWITHLVAWRGGPLRKALVLNCGNGWVERAMVERGAVAEAVGIDVGADLLGEAERAAVGMPIRYYRVNVNDATFPEDGYDLVVNHAAGHHITYVDRVFRGIATLLPDDGVLVSWDYVGPHRNQYPGGMWEAAHQVNVTLPDHLRSAMDYPRLATMLAEDPTEAIHSELVLPVTRRYFTIEHERSLGGGIAYLLLTQNVRFVDAPPDETAPLLDAILERDAAYTDADTARSLFAYLIARPDKRVLDDVATLTAWAAEEATREQRVAADDGRYYPPTAVADTIDRSIATAVAVMPPAAASRVAMASMARAVGRHVPVNVRARIRHLPGVDAAWRRLARGARP